MKQIEGLMLSAPRSHSWALLVEGVRRALTAPPTFELVLWPLTSTNATTDGLKAKAEMEVLKDRVQKRLPAQPLAQS